MSRIRNTSGKTIKKSKKINRTKRISKRRFSLPLSNARLLHVASLLFVLAGIGMLLFPSIYTKVNNLNQNDVASPAQTEKKNLVKSTEPIKIDSKLLKESKHSESPLRIVIPDVSIDLPVVQAKIVNGYWEVSETTASHGVGSANPGSLGNAVIFAHARDGLFLSLRNIKADQNIYVFTQSKWYRYRVEKIKEVTPDQIEVISPTDDERLTLFTCSGFLDNKRLIVSAVAFHP